MGNKPAVSILFPVRDAAASLPTAIESVANQRLTDWECLAIDDESRDGSRVILEAWAARDGRVRVLPAPAPGGIVAALEQARRRARADLLARQDADDRSHPERLAKQLARMRSDPGLAVLGCATDPAEARTAGMRRYLGWQSRCIEPERCGAELWIESPLAHPTVVMRAEAIDAVGGYREMGWPEDYDLWLRVHRAGRRIANLPEVLYGWTDRSDRLSRRDPRYSPEAFLRCRLHHLRRWLSERGIDRPLLVWGAGRDGKRLLRSWEEERLTPGPPAAAIEALVDIDPRKIGSHRRGRPILSFEDARARFPCAFYLAAVGVEGARDQIRAVLRSAGMREESDFLCLH